MTGPDPTDRIRAMRAQRAKTYTLAGTATGTDGKQIPISGTWETVSTDADQPAVMRDFAELWWAAEKIVYSRTLQAVSSART